MLENGYVKLYRSLLKWEWYDDTNTKVVFLHLLLTVSIEDSRWHGIVVKRGSRVSSYAVLAKETKLSIRQLRTSISRLESTGEVTRTKYPKYTVFTINNYDAFQSATSKTTSKRQSTDKVATVNRQQYKKVKEDKEDKEFFSPPPSSSSLSCTAAVTEEEVKAYASEIGAGCDVSAFYQTMQEQGWQSGGKPIRNWKAVFRAWEKKDGQQRENKEQRQTNEVYGTFYQNID